MPRSQKEKMNNRKILLGLTVGIVALSAIILAVLVLGREDLLGTTVTHYKSCGKIRSICRQRAVREEFHCFFGGERTDEQCEDDFQTNLRECDELHGVCLISGPPRRRTPP